MKDWLTSLRVYLDPRMLVLLGLGFSSGLPRLLVYSTLTFWLVEEGLDIASVGLFAATALPYNLKVLWAPLLDRLRLWGLGRLGLRRGWLVALQVLLAATIALMAATDPGSAPVWCAVAAIAVAVVSASQDVVIDAYRVELLDDDEQGAGAAVAVFGYRIGMLAASAGALYLAAFSGSWQLTYLAMAALVVVGLVATLLGREPARPEDAGDDAPLVARLRDAIIGPLRDFATRDGWLAVAAFVLLYKLGDALAGTMTNPFLADLGFEKTDIATIAKTYGLVASIVGVFLGGLLVRKLGVVAALWVAGALQMVSNLGFAWQALVGRDVSVLTATIGVENLTGGLATAAFVAYLSGLCTRRYTATQYALLTALSSLLHTLAGATTGYVATWMGWAPYFVATAAAALPGLVVLAWLTRRGWTGFEVKDAPP